MRLELTGRHVDITPMLRRAVDSKLARLTRMLNDNAVSAQVVLTREKRERRADVTLHARRSPRSAPGTAAVSRARPARVRPRMPPILRASRQALKVMSLTDAAREVGATAEGVLVFRDAETAAISVLFRGADGELTLVETEA
jgi:hypothetical protein